MLGCPVAYRWAWRTGESEENYQRAALPFDANQNIVIQSNISFKQCKLLLNYLFNRNHSTQFNRLVQTTWKLAKKTVKQPIRSS